MEQYTVLDLLSTASFTNVLCKDILAPQVILQLHYLPIKIVTGIHLLF